MADRLTQFLLFIILTILTLGIYPLFFFVTRQQESVDILKDIKEELKTLNDNR